MTGQQPDRSCDESIRIVVIVHARMRSSRLPGKALRELGGRPMILHTLDRLARCRTTDALFLATSTEAEDDPLARCVTAHGVTVHRGPHEDVAGRLLGAARATGADAIVRISGDSPFADPLVVDETVRLFRALRPELATNVLVRSFPKGLSVEVIEVASLARAHPGMDPDWREHVTTGFYRHPERYRIAAVTSGMDAGAAQLSVDTEEDFRVAERILDRLDEEGDVAGWHEVLAARAAIVTAGG